MTLRSFSIHRACPTLSWNSPRGALLFAQIASLGRGEPTRFGRCSGKHENSKTVSDFESGNDIMTAVSPSTIDMLAAARGLGDTIRGYADEDRRTGALARHYSSHAETVREETKTAKRTARSDQEEEPRNCHSEPRVEDPDRRAREESCPSSTTNREPSTEQAAQRTKNCETNPRSEAEILPRRTIQPSARITPC